MLESYFVKPQTVDRIRASWIGPEIERYVGWLAEHGYSARTVLRRVPVLVGVRGVRPRARRLGRWRTCPLTSTASSPSGWPRSAVARADAAARSSAARSSRCWPSCCPGFGRTGRPHRELPFADAVPGFFEYLAAERGLRPESIVSPTGITWPASRPTWTGSASPGWRSCRRRS